jgi:hypothetical protein
VSGVEGERTKYSCDVNDDGTGLVGRCCDDDVEEEVVEGDGKSKSSANDEIRFGPLRGAVVI